MEKVDILEFTHTYNDYLGHVPAGTIYIANQLREDNLEQALNVIKDFSEGVIWLSQASELLKRNGVTAELNVNKIQEFLEEVNNGLEKQDYILVADMFEYEIAPFFETIEPAKGELQ